jgi:hypothetical protein
LREILKANNHNPLELFGDSDKDKQGSLDFTEFVKMIHNLAPAIKDY